MSGIRRDGPDNALVRIHVTGASGAGTTTLGRALAAELGCPHFDSDDYFWLPTDPPCATKREAKERNRMLLTDLRGIAACVEAGSLLSWSEEITALFDAVVFLWIPQAIRLARLRARELAEIGRVDEDFMEWAKSYDVEGNRETRSLLLHEEWLTGLSCPVLRLEGDLSNAERLARAMEWLKSVQREAK